MSAALGLYRLQQVDSRISQIDARLRKIRETLENDAELQAALEKVHAAEADLRNAEQDRRASEQEAQAQQIKIQQAESSLYGGSVHNPKELQDLQADVASLKKHLSSIEEQELDAMQRVETATALLDTAKGQLEQLQARLSGEHRKLIDQETALARDLVDLQTERAAAVSTVASAILETYESLRGQHRGLAVAEVSENACAACGTTLTAALQQNARHSPDLVRCPSCGRILYAA